MDKRQLRDVIVTLLSKHSGSNATAIIHEHDKDWMIFPGTLDYDPEVCDEVAVYRQSEDGMYGIFFQLEDIIHFEYSLECDILDLHVDFSKGE